MNATIRLLDAVRAKLNITSDNQLALRWKISRQRIAEYRRGETAFSDERCIEVAEILGIDPGAVILEIHAERARKSARYAAADAFDALLRKLGTGVTALLCLFLAAPAPADAALSPSPYRDYSVSIGPIMPIMRSKR